MIPKSIKSKKSNKKEKYVINLFYTMMVVFVLHYWFFEVVTIGHDKRYNIYIFWIPLFLGSIVSGVCLFKDWNLSFKQQGKAIEKIILTFLFLLTSLFTSYLFFGQWVHIVWNYLNKKAADKNPSAIIYCDVRTFNSGRHPCVYFKYQSRSESLNTSYNFIKRFKDKSPEDYQVEIKARKGFWNYYVVEEWDIVSKN